jgi:hypothetical protein
MVDDKMTFEPERLSYVSANFLAEQVCGCVAKEVFGKVIVIVDVATLADFGNLQSSYLTLAQITAEYEALNTHASSTGARFEIATPTEITEVKQLVPVPPAAVPFVAPVATAVSAALGLVSLFRQDVEYHGAATTIDGLAFSLALAGFLKTAGAETVFLPDLMVMRKMHDAAGSLHAHVEMLEKAKAEAWQAASPLISRLVDLEGQLDTATKANDKKAISDRSQEVSLLRRELDPMLTALSQADQRLSALQAQWGQMDKAGLSILARLLRAETLLAIDSVVFLHAAVVSNGGHIRTTRSLWRTLFTGDGVQFMGGAVVRWGLLAGDGSVDKSGIVSTDTRTYA